MASSENPLLENIKNIRFQQLQIHWRNLLRVLELTAKLNQFYTAKFRKDTHKPRKPLFTKLETTKNRFCSTGSFSKNEILGNILEFFLEKCKSPVSRIVPKTLSITLRSQNLWFLVKIEIVSIKLI